LVVFDNADPAEATDQTSDNLQLLDEFWPTGRAGSILITSQDRRVTQSHAQQHIELDPFTEDEAVELLYKVSHVNPSRYTEKDAKQIVVRLEKIPFSIRVAAKTIFEYSLSFEEYLRIYDNDKLFRESEPLRGPGLHYAKTLRTVWALPYERLSEAAKDLLNIIVFMDVDTIKENMITNGVQRSQDPLLEFLSGDKLSLCRGKLIMSPLVSWNKNLKIMSMHRIVQRSCHHNMTTSRQTAFDRAVLVISSNWPRPEMHNRRQHSMWMLQEEFIQHVLSIHNYFLRSKNNSSDDVSNPIRGGYNFAELLYLAAW
jgi:hypothetical protein